ncbi:MAG: STAS domain-containing protein [Ignavibacteria bacterium]|nr:STAS domain-containing protein [Ignavibacteria bacterium]
MKIKQRETYNTVILELSGNVMGGPDSAELNNLLHKLLDEGKKNIIIDLQDVKFMNSSGLGMLIAGLTTVRNGGGELKLANATEKINSLLVVTKLITVFESFGSVEEAVASFK